MEAIYNVLLYEYVTDRLSLIRLCQDSTIWLTSLQILVKTTYKFGREDNSPEFKSWDSSHNDELTSSPSHFTKVQHQLVAQCFYIIS